MKELNLLLLLLFPAASIPAQQVNLTADVNRDGTIDVQNDEADEALWSWERGAVFLNNNDSDADTGEPDHADAILNGAADKDDLALMIVHQVPGLDPASSLEVTVSPSALPYVRMFTGTGTSLTSIDLSAGGNLSAAALAAEDIELYLEANSFATASWDGFADVTVTLDPPSSSPSTDAVRLRVAPWLMLHNGMTGTEVYLREYLGQNDVMKAQLSTILQGIGASLVVSPHSAPYPNNNIWMQDAYEVGYTEMPGQWMSVVLKSNRGSSWPLSNFPKDSLLAPDYGWFQIGSFRSTTAGGSAPDGWLDWFGNLEVTPPLPGYPFGRVYYGYNPSTGWSMDPAIVGMIDAQELQGPALAVDTGWLLIQHVDELVAWVPTDGGGYKILVPDTTVMYDLLDQWVAAGHGSEPMMRVYNSTETVAAFRNDTSFRNQNLNLQANSIEPVISALKTAWGLSESDVIRVPSAYYSNGGAYVPSMVNALVLNGHLFVSDPHGPEPAGEDLMQQHFAQSLADAGVSLAVHFLDDERYHKWSGNVHCATNARREGFTPGIWTQLTTEPQSAISAWQLY